MQNIILSLVLILIPLSCAPAWAMGQPPQPPGISELQEKISAELNQMDNDVAQAARQLPSLGLQSDATARILQQLYDRHSSVVAASTFDTDGNLLLVQPDKYKYSEGKNISDQPHFPRLKSSGKPVLSSMFMTVEGFYAVSLAYPVFSSEGQLIGFVSVVLQPYALMRNIIQPRMAGFPSIETLAIQTDGRVIYDKDILQVGKMTFSDPLYQSYPGLLELAQRIAHTESGEGSYIFPASLGKDPVKKATTWTTISLHGTEWRLVLSRIVN